jgi:antitoxin component of MazEF toxin-antitoxin module
MSHKVKIQPIGEALGVILPQEMCETLDVGRDDELLAVQTDAGILLTPYNPDIVSGLEAFEHGRKKYREASNELAKGYLDERAKRGSWKQVQEILARVPDVEPEPHDRR